LHGGRLCDPLELGKLKVKMQAGVGVGVTVTVTEELEHKRVCGW